MKILVFIFLTKFNFWNDTSCINRIAETILSEKFQANYYLFIPAKNSNGITGRLMITKANFIKLLVLEDSSYENNNILKEYLIALLNKEKIFKYDEGKFLKVIDNYEFMFLVKENKFIGLNDLENERFLKKNLIQFNRKDIKFNYNIRNNINEAYVFEKLFTLKYLVARGDWNVVAYKVLCE